MNLELEINGQIYQFRASFGFLRELNAQVKTHIDAINADEKMGMQLCFTKLIDGDVEALANVLDLLNKGQTPRLKMADLEQYIAEDADIDDLFKKVIDFLSNANVSKKVMQRVQETAREAEELKKAQMKANKK